MVPVPPDPCPLALETDQPLLQLWRASGVVLGVVFTAFLPSVHFFESQDLRVTVITPGPLATLLEDFTQQVWVGPGIRLFKQWAWVNQKAQVSSGGKS